MDSITTTTRHNLYRSSIIAGLFAALLFGVAGMIWQHEHIKEHESTWQLKADAAADRIARALVIRLDQVKRTAIIISKLPEADISSPTRFNFRVRNLVELSDMNLVGQWAPNSIIKYSYPLEGNEAAIGLDLAKHPNFDAQVAKSIQTKEGHWYGPFNLVQGGVGIVYSNPRFDANGRYVGLGTVLIKLPDAIVDMPSLQTYSDNANDIHHIVRVGSSSKTLGEVWSDHHLFSVEKVNGAINRWVVIPSIVRGHFAGSDIVLTNSFPSDGDHLLIEIESFHTEPISLEWYATTPWLVLFSILFGGTTGLIVLYRRVHKIQRQRENEISDLKSILDHSVNGKALYKTDGKFVWANRAMLTITHTRASDLEKESLFSGWFADIGCAKMAGEVLETGTDQILEYAGPTPYAEFVDIRIICSRVVIENTPHLLLQVLDVAGDHQLIKDAQASAIAKQEFLSVVSHEIRTPLNGILGMLDVLAMKNLDEKAKYYVNVAIDSGQLLLRIVNDILDFSKIEARRLDLDPVPTKLSTVFDQLTQLVNGLQHKSNVSVLMSADSAIKRKVLVDDARLKQVLLNLTSNAIKFTEQGEIVVTATLMPTSTQEKAVIEFSVKDTGIGISEAVLKKLFQPFTQADSGHTRKYGGTGLGLAISQSLVQAMGSIIKVTSTLDAGSTFSFTLELHYDMPEDTDYITEKALSGKRVMVVDDILSNRITLVTILENAGAEVYTANEGYDAVEQLGSLHSYLDIVLMDIQMPIVDGFEATQMIRSKAVDKINRLPIVAVTGNSTDVIKQQALAVGMDSVLIKPVSSATLISAVLNYCR